MMVYGVLGSEYQVVDGVVDGFLFIRDGFLFIRLCKAGDSDDRVASMKVYPGSR